MRLHTIKDKKLKKLLFTRLVASIGYVKSSAKKQELQSVLYGLVKDKTGEKIAMRSLTMIWELYKNNVWSDQATLHAICYACLHESPKIINAAVKIVLEIENKKCESDDSSSEDKSTPSFQAPNTGKKRKKAQSKQTAWKRKKQKSLGNNSSSSNSALYNLKNPQGFAEDLLDRVKYVTKDEIKKLMIRVIAQTVGIHGLHGTILEKLYGYFKEYIKPHQSDTTELLSAAVQACHDKVRPESVEPLLEEIVKIFILNGSFEEQDTSLGLDFFKRVCLQMPMLMSEKLFRELQAKVPIYNQSKKKAHKSVHPLIKLVREIWPNPLPNQDCGHLSEYGSDRRKAEKVDVDEKIHTDLKAKEVNVDDAIPNDAEASEHFPCLKGQ